MEEINVRRELKMSPFLLKILHDKIIIRKILITLGIGIVYRLIAVIPILGIDVRALRTFFEDIARVQGGTLLGMFSGGAMQRLTVLALGLMPYFSSCIIIMLLGAVTPLFRKYYVMGGGQGREKIVKSTYYLTIALSLIQAFFISLWLENPAHFQGLNIVLSPGWGFRIITVVTITTGVLLLLWLAKLINDYGIGNGVAILVLLGIMSKFPAAIYQLKWLYTQHALAGDQLFFLLLILIASIWVIWLITRSAQEIPINYNNSNIKNSITLRFSWAGKTPLGFTQSIILFPATIAALNPALTKFAAQISRGGWVYTIVYAILVVFFTYFFVAILFRPEEIVNKMKKYNCQIEKVESNKETAEYLDAKMTRNTMVTALFLIAIVMLPGMYGKIFRLPYLITAFIGGISLLIMIGIFYDLKYQINAYFKMKEDQNVAKWEIACIAFDEIEAELKRGFLETKSIPCVIEPLRFTWGMPIRTAVDQYRLYVPDTKLKESKEILL